MPDSLQRLFAPILYIVIFFSGFLFAAIWLDPEHYLADLPATLTTIAALALVLLAYFFSKLSLQHSRRESERLQILQQESVRPVLHTLLRPAADAPHLIELAVSNHGKGTAHAVKLSAESVAATPAAEAVLASLQPLTAFSDGLDLLAAGETFNGVFTDFDILAARFAPAPFNGIIKVVAEYQDVLGNACASESILDISTLPALQKSSNNTEIKRKPRKKLLY